MNAPADAVMREQLRTARLSRAASTGVAELVFTYYRWRNFMADSDDMMPRLLAARQLSDRFARDPDSFPAEELQRAVPHWILDEVAVTRDWLLALQTRPTLWLRAKRGTAGAVASTLGDCISAPEPFADALAYVGAKDLFRRPEFQRGEFEVQDIASQMVGLLCDPRPGETWWDACAGEGGKTLHLSDRMDNKGLIWATDRSARRLEKLKQRAARARAFNYRLAPWDGSEKLPTKTKFDGVLIDAPCSGVGTWQRNPHARWSTTMDDVRELANLQQQLILNAAAAVKPGGKLIYSVCTLTRTETDAVADLCSPQLSGFAPIPLPAWPSEPPATSGRRWIWPQQLRGNGMFVAAWQRVFSSP